MGEGNRPDGRPDILWRRKSSDETIVWQMDGLRYAERTAMIGRTTGDPLWKLCCTGDFNRDGRDDLLWWHEARDEVAVWLLEGTNVLATPTIAERPGREWQAVGAGDFGSVTNGVAVSARDGHGDIVWQSKETGAIQLWLMEGIQLRKKVQMVGPTERWRVMAAGDFGSSPTNSVLDGNLELVMSDRAAGALSIWFFEGLEKRGDAIVSHLSGGQRFTFTHDQDLFVTAAADFTRDGRTDLLVRHVTDGRNYVWEMDGVKFVKEHILAVPVWDTDWRMAGQSLEDSRWRLKSWTPAAPSVTVEASPTAPPTLRFQLFDYPTPPDRRFNVRRRDRGEGEFAEVLVGALPDGLHDPNVFPGRLYEYELQAVWPGRSEPVIRFTAGLEIPAVEDRGRVLVVVEQKLAAQIEPGLREFIEDLTGDGWEVIVKRDEPRHDDPRWTSGNARHVQRLRAWIKQRYEEDPVRTRSVILLGHVAVPYSGSSPSDGHRDHACPWSADGYYGDVAGPEWKDSGNGQFLDDIFPSPLELAVGRIDFARLPTFGVPESDSTSAAEAALVREYLAKNRRFRHGRAPFPLRNQAIFTTYVPWISTLQEIARVNAAALFGDYRRTVIVAEPFRNNRAFRDSRPPDPCLWAFASGYSSWAEIYNHHPVLKYTTPMLRDNPPAPAAFWSLLGSYFADFNSLDNFPRALLAQPDYGLAVLPSSSASGGPRWNMEGMAWGETLGECFLVSTRGPNSNFRWVNLQGDPTLRLHSVPPPTGLQVSRADGKVRLRWEAGASGLRHRVYRARSRTGPFQRVSGDFLEESEWELDPQPGEEIFMVRSLQLVHTGRGSHWNISQGTVAGTAPEPR